MLTDNQIAALDHRRHLSVTANAGAGKTTVLAQRFIEIVLRTETRVNEIAAITFTEKAASELKKKIAEHLEKRILQETETLKLITMERIRDQLVSANIGTIHSFCAQLLREYPVDAGIDASFVILEGIDRQLLEMEAFRETLESYLTVDDGTGRKEKLTYVLRMFGRAAIERYLQIFILKRNQIDRILQNGLFGDHERDDKEILSRWKQAFRANLIHKLETSNWAEMVSEILKGSNNKESASIQLLLAGWKQAVDDDRRIQIYHEMHNTLFTKTSTVRKKYIGHTDENPRCAEIVARLERHASTMSLLLEGVGEEGENGNRILLSVLRILLDIYKAVICRYDEKKLNHGYLDFDDILSKTNVLLSHPSVAPVIAKKFKYVMVDEFQDTNHLQYEIVQQLVNRFNQGNLFIVGDPKQSIYGFRDAEVAVFEAVRQHIATHPNGIGITLAESFRLLPNLIDFVNRVFSMLMGANTTQFDVAYDQLVQGRQNTTNGLVELLLVPQGDEIAENSHPSGGDALREECIMIAERIQKLIRDKHIIYTGREEHSRAVRHSDIAILVRQRTHVQMLESILGEYKIPALLSGGIGFYQTQEVYDFLNYFKFLLNRDDDIALVGILRSPFFTVSDVDLFTISRCDGNSIWEKLNNYSKNNTQSQFVQHVISILTNHQKITDRISIPSLVQTIYTDTGWYGTIAGLPMGKQYSANAEKLLQIARDFEGQGFSTLYDFIQRLQILVEHADRESQAPLDLKGNCVQVMTIHAAKGLEFPIVFLPFIHEGFHYDDPPYIDSEFGVALKVKDENNYDAEIVPSYVYFLRERSRQKTEAEEKRILYVACTRARDGLILSGQLKRMRGAPSYLQWLDDSLTFLTEDLKSSQKVFQSTALKILRRNDEGNKILNLEHQLAISIQVGTKSTPSSDIQQPPPTACCLPETINLNQLSSSTKGEIFSATQIKTYIDCPRKYYLKHILSLESVETPVQYHEEDEPDDVLHGELEGSITHTVLQTISSVAIDEDTIRDRIKDICRSRGISLRDDDPTSVVLMTQAVVNFINSGFGKCVLSAREFRTEYSISSKVDSDYLTGTIDRLYRNENGKWCIIDYKTDKIFEEAIHQRAASYKPQLLFYALLVSQLFDQSSVDVSIVFLRYPSNPVHYAISQSELHDFLSNLRQWMDSIKSGKFPENKPHCQFCQYFIGKFCIMDGKNS